MKKILTLVPTFVLLMSANVMAADGVVINPKSEVYTSSDSTSEVHTQYDTGETIELTGYENGFYQISENDTTYYIEDSDVVIANAIGTINDSNVNLRSEPNGDSTIISQLGNGTQVQIIGEDGDYYLVTWDGVNGYISKDYVTVSYNTDAPVPTQAPVEPVYAIVIEEEGVNFRSEPVISPDNIIGHLPFNTVVEVIEVQTDFVKVDYNGQVGYVSSDYVEISKGEVPQPKEQSSSSSLGQEIADYAVQFIGTPYVWGGEDLNNGVDCSGFVTSVYNHFGIGLSRSSQDMANNNGYEIPYEDLQPGDLVFFDNGGGNNPNSIDHVGIYIGNGEFVHSSSGDGQVSIDTITSGYYNDKFVKAKRVL